LEKALSYLEDSLGYLKHFEGSIAWMYLDTRGFVTVGVGELLANVARAQSLEFVDSSGQPATQATILAEFNRVSALASGQAADFYCLPTSPVLLPATIDTLRMNHVAYFDGQLSGRFAAYASFRDPAKLGLLDMIYNLGVKGLFSGFPHFMGCVDNQDWLGAFAQCHRVGPSPDRNAWTKQQFQAATTLAASSPQTSADFRWRDLNGQISKTHRSLL
jgi:GH24 family phage-related lysozyme (muramidase)